MRSKRKSKTLKTISNARLLIDTFSRYRLLTICVLIFAAALPGCSTLHRKTPEERQAEFATRELLSRLVATNQHLQHFKGIGHIQLEAGSSAAVNERVVWAASVPAKLSVAVLASGIPILKFASDGQHLYFVDMRDASGSFRKIRSNDPRLDRLISIPVRSSDIVLLLAGRLPIREHNRVRMTTSETGDRLLILERWWRTVEKIYLDPQQDEVHMVEFFDGQGDLSYRVEFEGRLASASYYIPRIIRFTGNRDAWLNLRIDRLFPDADIKPEMFILKPPKREASAVMR